MSGIGPDAQQRVTTDFRDQNRYIYMPTSPDQATGAKNYANEPGNNGASFLYDPSSLSTVRLRIVGDPAWLQQGDVATGVTARTFSFKPFNADGSINYDSQAVMFNVAFNTPTDYDLSTGIMDANAPIRGRPRQELYTFTAIQCKSIFSKGKFEQELEGRLLIEKNLKAAATGGRSAASQQSTGSRDSGRITDAFRGAEIRDETGAVSNLRLNEYGDLYDPAGTAGSALPSPRPAPPPQPATSTGDIRNNTPSTEFAAFEDALNPAPVARRNFGETDIDFSVESALIPTAPTPVPRRNFGTNDIDYANQSAIVPTPPQQIARDT